MSQSSSQCIDNNNNNKGSSNTENKMNDITENEELKTDSHGNGNGIIQNGTSSNHNHLNLKHIDSDKNVKHRKKENGAKGKIVEIEEEYIDPNDLLEVGKLKHHEIENFTMDEDELEKTCHPVSWSNCDATTFNVRRGPNYVSGQKSPSKTALYTVFAMDGYKLPSKINKIWKYINIEKYIQKYNVPYDKDKYPLPPLFILNCMVPNYPPELMGGKSDGEGYQLILYAHLSVETQQQLTVYSQNPQKHKLSPAVDLLRQFIHSDLVNSEIRNRFKCIARIMNKDHTDFGFLANRLVRRYNGKPFLARTSSTFYHEPGQYFAADIDAHLFGYPARQGLSYVKSTIQTAIYDIGFVIEGHSNQQLPEQILACCRISKMGVDQGRPFPDKFLKSHLKYKQQLQLLYNAQQPQQTNDNNPDNQQQPSLSHQKQRVYAKSQANLLQNGTHSMNNNNNNNNNNNGNGKTTSSSSSSPSSYKPPGSINPFKKQQSQITSSSTAQLGLTFSELLADENQHELNEPNLTSQYLGYSTYSNVQSNSNSNSNLFNTLQRFNYNYIEQDHHDHHDQIVLSEIHESPIQTQSQSQSQSDMEQPPQPQHPQQLQRESEDDDDDDEDAEDDEYNVAPYKTLAMEASVVNQKK